MPDKSLSVSERLTDALLDLVAQVPPTREEASSRPRAEAGRVMRVASAKAALTAGTLALPTGPLGWLTILPELMTVWRIQAQMVSDIAAVYGMPHAPTREQMLYCLFRHAAAQAVRDLVARASDRLLVQEASAAALQQAARAVGLVLTRRVAKRSASRWVPLLGAAGVGTYAWLDTRQVAHAAIEMFQRPRLTVAQA